MMNRMNSGSTISSPAAISATLKNATIANRCGHSQAMYSRRYSRRFVGAARGAWGALLGRRRRAGSSRCSR